jgi:hypothetical protein
MADRGGCMKVWCHECVEFHIDKDFREDFPRCGFLDRKGFGDLTDEEKLRLWQLWMNPLYDELAVKYRLMVAGGGRASPADVIMEDEARVFYPEGHSAKWRRTISRVIIWIAMRIGNFGRAIIGMEKI